ncbi:DUF2933 domain-containing protein [Nitrospirillum viridazoti]|uniref:DUF2933 family protein n=1 Tax=Nitrospirillum amazonense TaxID=28077 RepID=A0A560I663_9PROT|nr:DUF2933 domain-containing protein [Nitrospirillum amazonense]TWB54458.1 DUF2933 family protein [Nitrospirillum amazonense]
MDYRNGEASWWKTRSGIVLFGVAAVAAFFLFTGHRAHVFGLLPYLLLLACPLMHLFMHHGHGGHDHRGVNDPSRSSAGPATRSARNSVGKANQP